MPAQTEAEGVLAEPGRAAENEKLRAKLLSTDSTRPAETFTCREQILMGTEQPADDVRDGRSGDAGDP